MMQQPIQVPVQIAIPGLDEMIMERVSGAIKKSAETIGQRRQFPDWLSKGEAAEYANISRGTLEVFIKNGLRYSQVRSTVRIKRDDIDKFLAEHSY
jgi:excisionase family DNA binding protein